MSTSSPSDVETPPVRRRHWLPQFDLPLLFEIVAGAALAVALCVELGPQGLGVMVVAANVLLLSAYVCNERVRRKFKLVEFLVVMAIGSILAALLLPPIQSAMSGGKSERCRNNLRTIGLTLLEYHEVYGSFPPAVVNDPAGNPMHGWQVLLQPLFGGWDLYERYDLTQPWDGPNNQPLASINGQYMACDSMMGGPGATRYFFVTGQGRWADNQPPRLEDMKDGAEQTILVVESHTVAAAWSQPRPLTVDELLAQARSGQLAVHHYRPRHEWAPWRDGLHVLMADGNVRVLRPDLDERTWRALLTPAGGETIDLDDVLLTQGELPVPRMLLLTAGYVLIVSWRHWRPRRFRTSPSALQ